MNFAHIHLILNHVPILAIPLCALFLGHSLWVKSAISQKFSLWVLLGAALLVLPVYFTGEPAEKVVEHLPGVEESFIESHEDMALVSLVLTIAAGVSAGVALAFGQREKIAKLLAASTLAMALAASVSLVYTANLGGKIRHTELRSAASAPALKSED